MTSRTRTHEPTGDRFGKRPLQLRWAEQNQLVLRILDL
jgi:hypothetical protein